MSFVNSSAPNMQDYITFVLQQGVPVADLPMVQTTLTTTSGLDTATVGSATGLSVGMTILSQYVPPKTTITAISGTTLTLSSPAKGNGTDLTAYISQDFQSLQWTFNIAMDKVIGANAQLGILYVLAVYNLGMHQLIKIGLDIPGQTPNQVFFQQARQQFGILNFVGGVISGTADQNSSTTISVPELLKNLSLSDLDLLKTPWGRDYAGYAMNFGPYVVGVT